MIAIGSEYSDRTGVLELSQEQKLQVQKPVSVAVQAKLQRGLALHQQGKLAEAEKLYQEILQQEPTYVDVLHMLAVVALQTRRIERGVELISKAIELNPNVAAAHNDLGLALSDLNRNEEALASYDKAIALKPDFAKAYYNRGNTLNQLKRYEEALASYDKAIALKPDYAFLYGMWLHTKMIICDWNNLESEVAQLVEKIKCNEKISPPITILSISSSLNLQLRAAEIWALAKYPLNNTLPKITKHQRHDKIRIGYFSADLGEHPTAYLSAELFEKHDRSRFEVTAFSFGPNTNDAFDRFIDVGNQSDRDVALLARNLKIDIAVDLMGHTQDSRTTIFAMRAAPVQVNYLGYPGTMGAEYIDYLIADSILIPASNQKYFSERIVYLPHSYQASDTKRRIADKSYTRAEVGLAEDAFVFCCFNQAVTINPNIFDLWMRFLRNINNSVLWLLADNVTATKNLKREARNRGISEDRLIFAPRLPMADHLARHKLADLFLDTLPFNAHATASDALWAGLPVLTCVGETFPGRVAASLLNAIGLPELITSTTQEYETLAIELATNPEKLAAIKHKLASNRLTTPLFDTQKFTRHIEAAYTMMYERYQADLPPDHIYVL